VLIGLIVYGLVCRRGALGDFGLLFTLPGMAIGQTILALPIIISLTAQAVESLDERCSQTLLTLGANKRQVAVATIRELRFSIMTVAVTAFGRVVTEVGIAMMLGGNIKWETRTITTAIALETNKGEFAQGMALGIVLLAVAFALNFALSYARRKDRA
jgi:tungstate transport system permease protein